jgi:regulatory protein
MNEVTVVETRKHRRGVRVILDRCPALNLSLAVATEAGLHTGQTLTLAEIERLKSTEQFHRSLNSALRYMSSRPRSEVEVRNRLSRHGFDIDTIQKALAKLKKQGLVDDIAFAQFWRENREDFKPRSRRLMALELKQKGVDAEIIAEAIIDVDDRQGAYWAAQKKSRALTGLDYDSFRKRLGSFLKRRGFDYELINHTIDRMWQEHSSELPDQR